MVRFPAGEKYAVLKFKAPYNLRRISCLRRGFQGKNWLMIGKEYVCFKGVFLLSEFLFKSTTSCQQIHFSVSKIYYCVSEGTCSSKENVVFETFEE